MIPRIFGNEQKQQICFICLSFHLDVSNKVIIGDETWCFIKTKKAQFQSDTVRVSMTQNVSNKTVEELREMLKLMKHNKQEWLGIPFDLLSIPFGYF